MASTAKPVTPPELRQAVAKLAQCLSESGVDFSISGGAAVLLIGHHNKLPLRITEDIDLVVRPTETADAESVSTWLLSHFPTLFVAKTHFGVSTPALVFQRHDQTVVHIEIEVFDVKAWPQRPQYNLDDPKNTRTILLIDGIQVPVFSAEWLLREKIVTAYQRQGSRKATTDVEDATMLLDAVAENSIDMTAHDEAVQHFLQSRPDLRLHLELRVKCPNVLGNAWIWDEAAGVHWRFEGDQLHYLDGNMQSHKFKYDEQSRAWYFTDIKGSWWFYDENAGDIRPWN